MNLGCLPDLVLENILCFFSYDEIAKYRRINCKFNLICKSMLNKGFKAIEKYHTKCLKDVKSKLPRRESERRDQPLARHGEILSAIETRISLLGMTFMKYVEHDLCCFIPGKVIDEIYAVLRKIQNVKCPSRSCEVLQELRDISSMAMEYFDEKIVPGLTPKLSSLSPLRLGNGSYFSSIYTSGTGFSLSMRYSDGLSPPGTPLCTLPIQHPASEPANRARPSFARALSTPPAATRKTKTSSKMVRDVRDLKRQVDSYKTSVESQNKKMLELERRNDQQDEFINQQNARLAELEEKLAEMSRRVAENTSQFTDLADDSPGLTSSPRLGLKLKLGSGSADCGSSCITEVAEASGSSVRKRVRSSDSQKGETSPKKGRR